MAAKPLKGYRRLPGSKHRYLTPSGKNISEYQYRSLKAKKAGFRNYSDQRRLRESRTFRQLRFQVLSADPDADIGSGSQLERQIAKVRSDRRAGKVLTDAGPEGELRGLLAAVGAPDWMFWRFWYGDTTPATA